jgi:zinc/manganese transport system permease protein
VNSIRQMLGYPFMVNALRAGTIVAVVSGVMGWFMVLRRQTFAGHTLSLVGFPGAAGAVLVGIPSSFGYFGVCAAAAVVIGGADARAGTTTYRQESALIGTVQAMALAGGFLFVSLYHGNLNGLTGLLFGSFLGVTSDQVLALLAVGVGTLLALGFIARPLLLASIDPEVARAAGLPARALAVGFLLLLGVAVAETAQITGALLVFALLVLPPATAQIITGRPGLGLALSVGLATAVTWAGLAAAYYTPYPTGAYITTFSFAAYVLVRGIGLVAKRDRARPAAAVSS